MKKFEIPMLEIQRFDPDEAIATSGTLCFEIFQCVDCYCTEVVCDDIYECDSQKCPTLED